MLARLFRIFQFLPGPSTSGYFFWRLLLRTIFMTRAIRDAALLGSATQTMSPLCSSGRPTWFVITLSYARGHAEEQGEGTSHTHRVTLSC